MNKKVLDDVYKVIAAKKVGVPVHLFYHAFTYDSCKLKEILINGLKCPLLTKKYDAFYGFNGLFYISLVKYPFLVEDESIKSYRAFDMFYKYHPMFLIDDINPVKCNVSIHPNIFSNTPIPKRTSCYVDEYQQFWKIDKSKFYGLAFPLLGLIEKGDFNSVLYLKDIVNILDELELDLNIYDYSNVKENDVRLIDKEKVKKLIL